MPVTVLLELKFKPEAVSEATEVFRRELVKTRAFDGNLVTDVLVTQTALAGAEASLAEARWSFLTASAAYERADQRLDGSAPHVQLLAPQCQIIRRSRCSLVVQHA